MNTHTATHFYRTLLSIYRFELIEKKQSALDNFRCSLITMPVSIHLKLVDELLMNESGKHSVPDVVGNLNLFNLNYSVIN